MRGCQIGWFSFTKLSAMDIYIFTRFLGEFDLFLKQILQYDEGKLSFIPVRNIHGGIEQSINLLIINNKQK